MSHLTGLELIRMSITDAAEGTRRSYAMGTAHGVASCKQPLAIHSALGAGTVVGVSEGGEVEFIPDSNVAQLVRATLVSIYDLAEVQQ